MEFNEPKDRLIVALPIDDLLTGQTLRLMHQLTEVAGGIKIRPSHLMRYGHDLVRCLAGFTRVFLDLKSHDIPIEVEADCREAAWLDATFVTVDAGMDIAALAAARKGSREGPTGETPTVLGVTVLTNESTNNVFGEYRAMGQDANPPRADQLLARLMLERCRKAVLAKLDGVVAPSWAINWVHLKFPKLLIVTAGIRFDGDPLNDHQNVMTPHQAIKEGADCIVMGRSIIGRDDPVAAAKLAVAHIAAALEGRKR